MIAADSSGVGKEQQAPADFSLAKADPAYRGTDAEFAGVRVETVRHGPGIMAGSITGPIPTEPQALGRALRAAGPGRSGNLAVADVLLGDLDNLATSRYVPLAVRVAALRLLAATPGLTYHPAVTDRAGRRGVAVSTDVPAGDNPALRHTLILDPRTGHVLAYEQRLTTPEPDLRVPPGTVYLYSLWCDASRTTTTP